jgi:hypothetical protein
VRLGDEGRVLPYLGLSLDPGRSRLLCSLGGLGSALTARPMIRVAGIIRRHLENILKCLDHRITNAVTGGLNAKIQWITYSSRAFGIGNDSSSRSTSTAVT